MQLFVARRDGRDVGRIAAILDRNHNEFHGEKAAFFGFFESENDPEVAGKLLEAAALWGRERKMTDSPRARPTRRSTTRRACSSTASIRRPS